jgi:O-acetyl-ADP-ribose deacetylase (regulator of RNase III)
MAVSGRINMVRMQTGNLFDSEAQTLVNAVNCAGVMGKGIALAFKRRYPTMFADYLARCKDGHVQLGELYLYRGSAPPYILNFPTKNHWRSAAKLGDIVAGLAYLEAHYRAWGITSLAAPALGCGAGQLAWDDVGPLLQESLGKLDIPVELYAPGV